MQKKLPLSCRVYRIAERYNVEQTKTHLIINSYIDYCKETLLNGHVIDFLGLVSVIPDKCSDRVRVTTAYECKTISDSIGLPWYTVFSIVDEYLDSLKEDLLNGIDIEIRGLLNMHPIRNEDGEITGIHSAISSQIRDRIRAGGTYVDSVRVHTHKLLKYNLKKRVG